MSGADEASGHNNGIVVLRTIKYMQALLQGQWVVDIEWYRFVVCPFFHFEPFTVLICFRARRCLNEKRKVSEQPFEVVGDTARPHSEAPRKMRLARKRRDSALLFDGIAIYVNTQFSASAPQPEVVIDLLKLVSFFVSKTFYPLALTRSSFSGWRNIVDQSSFSVRRQSANRR